MTLSHCVEDILQLPVAAPIAIMHQLNLGVASDLRFSFFIVLSKDKRLFLFEAITKTKLPPELKVKRLQMCKLSNAKTREPKFHLLYL